MNSVVKPTAPFLASAKVVNPKNCCIEQDSHLKAPVLRLKGDVDKTRVQIPKEDRPLSALQLAHSLAAMQIFLNSSNHFAIEFTVAQGPVVRTKLIVGTHIKEAFSGSSEGNGLCKLPLVIPRNRWVQVIIHVAGIVENIFSLPKIKTIDGIALMGAAKIRGVSTTSSEQDSINSTPPGMTLFAVPAYAQPIWTTAAKEKTTEQQAAVLDSKPRLSFVGDGNDVANESDPVDSAAGTSDSKLPAITKKPTAPEPASLKTTAPPSTNTSVRNGGAEPPSSKPSARQNPAPYIRFVDKANDAPSATKNNSSVARRGDGVRERSANSSNAEICKGGISSWEESSTFVDVFDTTALVAGKEGEAEERRLPRPEQTSGGPEERAQRAIGARKGRTDASLPPPRKRSTRSLNCDVSSPNFAARRQQRAKTQAQILKANDQAVNKCVVERARLASQVALNNTPSAADGVVVPGVNKQLEPICGYGFGYMGLMRESGRYEDEEGDPNLKGVLMLNVDGGGDEE